MEVDGNLLVVDGWRSVQYLMTCQMEGKMRSEVIGFRSAELLPAATVVISLCVSLIKMNSVCFFVRFFMSEVKSGRPAKSNMWN